MNFKLLNLSLESLIINTSTNMIDSPTLSQTIVEDINIYSKLDLSSEGKLTVDRSMNEMSIFLDVIRQYAPVFAFYIRKVDKSIRKHSRGKSGKYLLI